MNLFLEVNHLTANVNGSKGESRHSQTMSQGRLRVAIVNLVQRVFSLADAAHGI